jgi:hypothetical protein
MSDLPTQQFINGTAWYGLVLKRSTKLSGLDVGPGGICISCFQGHSILVGGLEHF